MDADGSSQARLTTREHVDDEDPAWSPDGAQVIFSRSNGTTSGDLWVIDLATRAERPLTQQSVVDYAPSWSPDGKLIAFRRSAGRTTGVYVVPADGGEARFVWSGRSPAWHPDGGRIVYSDEGCIWVVAVNSTGRPRGEPARVTGGSSVADDCPCWSPDGTRLAFERELIAGDVASAHILTVRDDGQDCRDLGEGHTPDWSARASE